MGVCGRIGSLFLLLFFEFLSLEKSFLFGTGLLPAVERLLLVGVGGNLGLNRKVSLVFGSSLGHI